MNRQALIFASIATLLSGCAPNANKSITSAADLTRHEGRVVAVSGTLSPSDVRTRTPVALHLSDGAHIYIGSFTAASGLDLTRLDPFYHRAVVIDGTLYTGEIPASHGILSRLSGPYLVDISSIKAVDR